MSESLTVIHNVETGEIIERPMTPEELAQTAKDKAKSDAEKLVAEEAAIARQALLAKLGITEEETRLLLGGN